MKKRRIHSVGTTLNNIVNYFRIDGNYVKKRIAGKTCQLSYLSVMAGVSCQRKGKDCR